ncbi:MAG: nucleoside deaminase [Ilumatobacteraceae bacterium]
MPDTPESTATAAPNEVWRSLSVGWRQAFDEAWQSWCAGDLGIGAALVDPTTDTVVSAGRNRVNQAVAEERTLSGNFMAHAEMNAFAALDRFKADGLHLYTTLEPCLMCAATTVFLHVEHVHFASTDEFFVGVDDLWNGHEYTSRWKPDRSGPRDDQLATFARILPLTRQVGIERGRSAMAMATRHIPTVAALAVDLTADRTLHQVAADGGETLDALRAVWERISP